MLSPKVDMPNEARAVAAYRAVRSLPPDWEPDWGSTEWNWFKIGWDACWIADVQATGMAASPSVRMPRGDATRALRPRLALRMACGALKHATAVVERFWAW